MTISATKNGDASSILRSTAAASGVDVGTLSDVAAVALMVANIQSGGLTPTFTEVDIVDTATTISRSGAVLLLRNTDTASSIRLRIGSTDRVLATNTGASVTGVAAVTGGLDLTGACPTAAASHVAIGGTVRTTVGANGAATALTANPLGYLDIDVAGTIAQIPYYNRGS